MSQALFYIYFQSKFIFTNISTMSDICPFTDYFNSLGTIWWPLLIASPPLFHLSFSYLQLLQVWWPPPPSLLSADHSLSAQKRLALDFIWFIFQVTGISLHFNLQGPATNLNPISVTCIPVYPSFCNLLWIPSNCPLMLLCLMVSRMAHPMRLPWRSWMLPNIASTAHLIL